ncbi:MAG TPA: SAM-dependent methyltransferase, partial [Candidatus Accumulibacter sp.]|nr:SAM-dependent methyltransferase [Accumulibacter sp.]
MLLDAVQTGSLEIRLPDGSQVRCGQTGDDTAALEIDSWAVFDRVIERGDVGFAEAFIDGEWHSPDLAALLTLLANNRQHIASVVYGRWWSLLAARLRHLFNANTRSGSRRNIMAHYDLGNDFYRLWLDPTMSYSSALYPNDAPRPLAGAQLAKYRRILQLLQARPGQRVLEIGCGWGGFAEIAAREAGLQVVGLTLSPAQAEFARERLQMAGVADQARIELCDYRDLGAQQFDHIVSIEMFEAVGERWWPTYFATLKRLLAADGRAVVQSITIRDELFARYRRGTDFIQQHVFPGGMLPSPTAFRRRAAQSGLVVSGAFAFARDYARTLSEWSARFEQQWPRIAAL